MIKLVSSKKRYQTEFSLSPSPPPAVAALSPTSFLSLSPRPQPALRGHTEKVAVYKPG